MIRREFLEITGASLLSRLLPMQNEVSPPVYSVVHEYEITGYPLEKPGIAFYGVKKHNGLEDIIGRIDIPELIAGDSGLHIHYTSVHSDTGDFPFHFVDDISGLEHAHFGMNIFTLFSEIINIYALTDKSVDDVVEAVYNAAGHKSHFLTRQFKDEVIQVGKHNLRTGKIRVIPVLQIAEDQYKDRPIAVSSDVEIFHVDLYIGERGITYQLSVSTTVGNFNAKLKI